MYLLQLTILSVLAVVPLAYGQNLDTATLSLNPSFDPNKIILQLCTQDNMNGTRLPNNGPTTLLNMNKLTVFLIHGWQDSMFVPWMVNATRAYLTKEDINVIKVDWSYYADNVLYPLPRAQVSLVGDVLAKFIVTVSKSNSNGFFSQVHLVGHSLGAHIAGFAGQGVQSKVNAKIKRITGLDAAGPLFEDSSLDQRLSSGDADIVDGIHTTDGTYGLAESYADIDFYPNGGIAPQPGCLTINSVEGLLYDTILCSHLYSTQLFISSITTDQFVAVACSSYVDFVAGLCRGNAQAILGEMLSVESADEDMGYYLQTGADPPYALGETDLTS